MSLAGHLAHSGCSVNAGTHARVTGRMAVVEGQAGSWAERGEGATGLESLAEEEGTWS